jgi:hypothetical protein
MMKKQPIFLFFAMLIVSCGSPTNPPQTNYLLNNYTFDSSGRSFYKGWIYSGVPIEDTVPQFVNVVPPGSSAKLSIALSPGRIPSSEFVHYDLKGLSSGIYELSLWGKSTSKYGSGGIVAITKNSLFQPWNTNIYSGVSDTSWQQIILRDTLTLIPTDIISITLTGGVTEVASWTVFYNNISFQKIQ